MKHERDRFYTFHESAIKNRLYMKRNVDTIHNTSYNYWLYAKDQQS